MTKATGTLADIYERCTAVEATWTPFHEGSPPKKGYYFARDCNGRDGVAFMNPNKTWTLIDNLKKPLVAWRAIP